MEAIISRLIEAEIITGTGSQWYEKWAELLDAGSEEDKLKLIEIAKRLDKIVFQVLSIKPQELLIESSSNQIRKETSESFESLPKKGEAIIESIPASQQKEEPMKEEIPSNSESLTEAVVEKLIGDDENETKVGTTTEKLKVPEQEEKPVEDEKIATETLPKEAEVVETLPEKLSESATITKPLSKLANFLKKVETIDTSPAPTTPTKKTEDKSPSPTKVSPTTTKSPSLNLAKTLSEPSSASSAKSLPTNRSISSTDVPLPKTPPPPSSLNKVNSKGSSSPVASKTPPPSSSLNKESSKRSLSPVLAKSPSNSPTKLQPHSPSLKVEKSASLEENVIDNSDVPSPKPSTLKESNSQEDALAPALVKEKPQTEGGHMEVPAEIGEKFQELKIRKKFRYLIFKINDWKLEIEKAETDKNKGIEDFLKDLPFADCRFAIYDHEAVKTDQYGSRVHPKVYFILWTPTPAPVQMKMLYSTERKVCTLFFTGVEDFVATKRDDILITTGVKGKYEDVDSEDEERTDSHWMDD